jgi:hypothetical protein
LPISTKCVTSKRMPISERRRRRGSQLIESRKEIR